MQNTATRLISLIMLLQRKPNQKAGVLADELGVSIRTVHRYIAMLDEMGIPVYSERGPHGGFSLVRGYKMPPLVFSPQEAVAVFLGVQLTKELWGNLYRAAAQSALAKLENVLPSEQLQEVSWARKALVATGLHRADHKHIDQLLATLQPAIRDHLQVDMSYQAAGKSEETHRRLHPYALVYRWGWWYVVGHCCLRNAVRTFRVDRIKALTTLEDTFEVPCDFSLTAYLAAEPQGPMIEFKLYFPAKGAHIAKENAIHWETLQVQADGSLIATYLTPSLEWGVSMVLSYGPFVEILEPQQARQMIAAWSHEITHLYEREKR